MMARSNLSHLPTAVPSDVRPKYEAITALTDAFCTQHLNEEYAEMCRRLTAALARRRPTPLRRGRKDVWACGIVRTIGWVNILDDPSQSPHMKLIDIDPKFGVANSTGQGKSKAIRRMLGIGRLNPDWTLPSRYADNPLVWNVEIDETLVDIRQESREQQEAAFQEGLIPYIPADQTTPDHLTTGHRTARRMKSANEQLLEEVTYPHLASFLRSGGTLEVGEDFSLGGFARIRKGNKTIVVDSAYQDFAAILKQMDSTAKNHLEETSGGLEHQGASE